MTHWQNWHSEYDRPDSALSKRLEMVKSRLGLLLDEAPPGPLRLISMCAGQGRDVIGALREHPRRDDVSALLVELDPGNASFARELVGQYGLSGLDVVIGDASQTDHYASFAPADLVLMCGMFGNMTDADVRRAIGYCKALCRRNGFVIWTRARWVPDLVPEICDWFSAAGFDEVWLSPTRYQAAVGVHRFTGEPTPLEPGARMFSFTGRSATAR